MKYIDHLKELRKRILLSFFVLIVSFCIFLYYASFVGEILSKPLFDLFDDSDKKRGSMSPNNDGRNVFLWMVFMGFIFVSLVVLERVMEVPQI